MESQTQPSPRSVVELRPADPADGPLVYALVVEASEWQIHNAMAPWIVSEALREEINAGVQAGTTYVAEVHGQPVGAVRIETNDAMYWPEATDRAAYVQKLVVARAHAGRGFGLQILSRADEIALARGIAVMRLVADGTTASLVRLYRAAGYSVVDESARDGWIAVRMEKSL